MNEIFTYEMLEELGTAFSTGEMIYNVTLYILAISSSPSPWAMQKNSQP